MDNKEPDWLALSSQEDMPTQVLPGHHWEKNKTGKWSQIEDNAEPEVGSKIPDEVSYLKDIQIKKAPVEAPMASSDGPTPVKTPVKQYTPPNKAPVVTPAMIKAAGAADLREYLNMQRGLIDRRAASVVNKKAGVPPEDFLPQRLYPKVGAPKSYAKGGKISLDACGVSTHTPSKKTHANW